MNTTVEEPETAMPPPKSGRTAEGSAKSCRNAIRDGCRSLTHFPEDMQQLIDAKDDVLHAQFEPRNELEGILLEEIACASIQVRICESYVELDKRRVQKEADDEVGWTDSRRTDVNALAERLGRAPHRVAHQLEQSLQGAQYCLEHWVGLGDSVEANGRLTEEQRQFTFDLLGVSKLARDNTKKVPAGDDAEGLRDLIARQVKRLENRIESDLKSRDLRARAMARLGVAPPPDAETRRVRSNYSRANKRLKWAAEMFWRVRNGVALGQPLDPDEVAAILKAAQEAQAEAPGQGQAQARRRARPAASPSPSPSSSSSPSAAQTTAAAAPSESTSAVPPQGDGDPLPVPENLAPEDRETLYMLNGLLFNMLREAGVGSFVRRRAPRPPDGAPPKTD
jgi:hypothetical protein